MTDFPSGHSIYLSVCRPARLTIWPTNSLGFQREMLDRTTQTSSAFLMTIRGVFWGFWEEGRKKKEEEDDAAEKRN